MRGMKSDTRSKGFGDISVELDAIDPNDLRGLVESVIEEHLPPEQFEVLKAAEKSEREIIAKLVRKAGSPIARTISTRRRRKRCARSCEFERIPQHVWEPACGPGAIVRELRAVGHSVFASDISSTTAAPIRRVESTS